MSDLRPSSSSNMFAIIHFHSPGLLSALYDFSQDFYRMIRLQHCRRLKMRKTHHWRRKKFLIVFHHSPVPKIHMPKWFRCHQSYQMSWWNSTLQWKTRLSIGENVRMRRQLRMNVDHSQLVIPAPEFFTVLDTPDIIRKILVVWGRLKVRGGNSVRFLAESCSMYNILMIHCYMRFFSGSRLRRQAWFSRLFPHWAEWWM